VTFAQRVLDGLGATMRQRAGAQLTDLVEAISSQLELVDEMLQPTERGWAAVFDASSTPAPKWLGVVTGTTVPPGLTVQQQRDYVATRPQWRRGTPAAIIAAVKDLLGGEKIVTLVERDGSPWHLTIRMYKADAQGVTSEQILAAAAGVPYSQQISSDGTDPVIYLLDRSTLYAAWDLNEGSGSTAADATGNAHTGAVASPLSWGTGYEGGCVTGRVTGSWARTSPFVTIGAADGTSWTYGGWVKLDKLPTSGGSVWPFATDTSSGASWSDIGVNSGGAVFFEVGSSDGSRSATLTSSGTLTANTWHHVALVVDASAHTATLYVDGVQYTPQSTSGWTTAGVYRLDLCNDEHSAGSTMSVDSPFFASHAMTHEEVLQWRGGPGGGHYLAYADAGPLPDGLTWDEGLISGTPTTPGDYSIAVLSFSASSSTTRGLTYSGSVQAASSTYPVSGTASAASTASGAVHVRRAVTALAASATAVTATVTALLGVTGSASSSSTVAGGAQLSAAVSGTSSLTSAVSGGVTRTAPITGQADSTTAVSGEVKARLAVTGTAASATTVTGSVSLTGEHAASGTTACTSQTSGTVTAHLAVTGTATATSSTTGSADLASNLAASGTVTITSSATGSVLGRYSVAGTVVSHSTAAAVASYRNSHRDLELRGAVGGDRWAAEAGLDRWTVTMREQS